MRRRRHPSPAGAGEGGRRPDDGRQGKTNPRRRTLAPAALVARATCAKFFRGFALLARRDIFSSGIAHPRTPTPKVVPFGIGEVFAAPNIGASDPANNSGQAESAGILFTS